MEAKVEKVKPRKLESGGALPFDAQDPSHGSMLMEEINQSLGRWLEEHFRVSGISFTVQGKLLDYDELAGVKGLLAMLYANVQSNEVGRLFGFDWYARAEATLVKVAPVLSGDPDDLGAITALRDAIIQKVGAQEVSDVEGVKTCSIDGLYEDFYSKAHNNQIFLRNSNKPTVAWDECSHLFAAKKYGAALGLLHQVVSIRRHIFGVAHIDTLNCEKQIALCFAEMGEFTSAIKVMETHARMALVNYGEAHKHTLQAQRSLALMKGRAGNRASAIEMVTETLSKATQFLGWEHALTQGLISDLNQLRIGNGLAVASEAKVVVCDPGAFEARRKREADKDNERMLENLVKVSEPKRVPLIAPQVLEEIERIGIEQPNFAEVTELILNTLHSQCITGRAAQLQPMLLLGAPGVGKTRYVKRVAAALGLPFLDIQLAGVADAFKINGLSRYWSNAGAGSIAHAFAEHDVVNPVFLLDELDKACVSEQTDPYSAILLLLERETASKFKDSFLDLPLDVSRASFIATANGTDRIPEPLLSRMHCIEIEPLDMTGRQAMIRTVYHELLLQEGMVGLLDVNLPLQTVERLAASKTLGGREIKREVLLAMQRACRGLQLGAKIAVQPLLPQHLHVVEKQKRPMGFY